MAFTIEDYRFLFKKGLGKLMGLMGTYVDDVITEGSKAFVLETKNKLPGLSAKSASMIRFVSLVYISRI